MTDPRPIEPAAPRGVFSGVIRLFLIWGIQGAAAALLDIFAGPSIASAVKPMLLVAALLAGLPALYRLGSAALTRPALAVRILAPALVLAVTAFIIRESGSAGPFFLDLFRALSLAAFYILLGAFFGRRFVWLGVWLIALTVLLMYRYLGYAPIVLEGYGGLSLLACASLLQAWLRQALAAQEEAGQGNT